MQELEQSLANWGQNMKELGSLKADLAHYLLAEDMLVLREQVELLHRQWEELCLRVSGFKGHALALSSAAWLGSGSAGRDWISDGVLGATPRNGRSALEGGGLLC